MPALVAALASCGGAPVFQYHFPENRSGQIETVLDRLESARPSEAGRAGGEAVIVLSRAGQPGGLLAFDVVRGRAAWTVDLPVDSPPFVGGGVVVVRSGDELVSFSLADGDELGRRGIDEDMTLMGVSIDGGVVAATLGGGTGGVAATGRYGELWIMDEGLSRRVAAIRAEKLLGAPAVAGGLVFLPWDSQMISAIDASTGAEICRLNLADEMVSWVVAAPEGVFYGSKGVFRLTRASESGTKAGSAYVPIEWVDPEYPGQPALHFDAFEGIANGDPSARARVRLAWHPAPGRGERDVGFADDRLYFVYYRYVVAVRPASRDPAWVRSLESPAAEVFAVPGGIWVVEESGAARFLAAADGADAWVGDVGTRVRRAAFRVSGFVPSPGAAGRPGGMRRQVMDALLDPDTQAVPVRRMLLVLFGRSEDADVSRDLLVVLRDPAMPAEMRDAAARSLRLRRDGAAHLKDALGDRYDFLRDVPAPPVGVIAGALMNMNERPAVSALLGHLADPSTSLGDLEELIRAIVALGDPTAMEPLRKFLAMYHADTEFAVSLGPLVAAAMGILAHGGEAGERHIETLIADPFTGGALRAALTDMLAAHRSAAPAVEARPQTIDREQFAAFVESRRAALDPCLRDLRSRRPGVTQFDMGVTASGDGRVVDLVVAPADSTLAACLRSKLDSISLPVFRARQDRFVVPIVL